MSKLMKKEEGKRELKGPPIPQESTFKFGLGWELRDVISGCVGICIYRVDNITACNQYGLQQKAEKPTDARPEGSMFDETRLEFTGNIIELVAENPQATIQASKPGGISKLFK